MKKLFFVLVMVMSVLMLNAQDNKTPGATESKSPSSSTATTIRAADLPKTITDNISKEYPGWTIKEASSVTGKSGLNYQVAIMKGDDHETLLYDNNGKFLRKVASKADRDMKDTKDTKKKDY